MTALSKQTTLIVLCLAAWLNPGPLHGSDAAFAGDHAAHMRGIIRQAESLLAVRRVRDGLAADDVRLADATVESARAALAAGDYARAWFLLTHWRFWILVHEIMPARVPMQHWLVAGPFPKSASPAVEEALAGPPWADGSGIWRQVDTRLVQGMRTINDGINRQPGEALLAAVALFVTSNQTVRLEFRTREALEVRLNGRPAASTAESAQGPAFRLDLSAGWNRLLIQSVRTGPDWGVAYRLTDTRGTPVHDMETACDVLSAGELHVRVQGPVLREVWRGGDSILQTQYLIFSGADTRTRRNFNVNLCGYNPARHPMPPGRLIPGPEDEWRLEWEGVVPGSDGHVDLHAAIRITPHKVSGVYHYVTGHDLHPHFRTDDPTRVFDRQRAVLYDRLFYWTLVSHSLHLWDTGVALEVGDTQRLVRDIPPRDSGQSVTLASGAIEAPCRAVFDLPEGAMTISFDAESLETATLWARTRQPAKEGRHYWFFGFTDHATGKRDVLPAGYSNTVTVVCGFHE